MKRYIRAAVLDLSQESLEDRRRIAENPNTNARTLLALLEDEQTRYYALRNPSMPVSKLAELSESPDEQIRVYVAANPSTPVNILRKLAADISWRVRIQVAANPNLPEDIMYDLLTAGESHVYQYLGNNPHVPVDILQQLSEDPDWAVRLQVAYDMHNIVPKEILEALENDRSEPVRSAARNSLRRF